MKRVLVIGIDGATWNLLRPWIKEGNLSTFKRLMEEGVYGELESTAPPLSIPAWVSLASGKNPGKLGNFSFMSLNRETNLFRPDFLYTQHRCIWDILENMGKKVIVVNAPNVHKAYKINGYLIAGFLYLDKAFLTYPEDLKKDLDEVTGGYEVDVLDAEGVFETVEKRFEFIEYLVSKERRRKYIERVHTTTTKHFEAVKFLLKKEWDFAFVVFVSPDRVQHRFWDDKKLLLDVYKRLDDTVEKLLTQVGKETTVFIVSDHGFGPRRRVFNINDWLLKEGYLHLKTKNIHQQMKINDFLRRIGRLPFAKDLANFLPFRLRVYLGQGASFKTVKGSDIDWKLTRVFTQPSEQKNYGDLYLNLKGKNATGALDPCEYKKTRDEIIQKLRSLRDSITGDTVSARVYKREDIYNGEHLEKAPDMVIFLDNAFQGFDTTIGHDQMFMLGEGGEHTMQGIFLACGPNIKRGAEIKGARIYDIAPTILRIFDLPIPRDVDGKVLKEIFEEWSEPARQEIKYTATGLSKSETESKEVKPVKEDEIKKRLHRLGYF